MLKLPNFRAHTSPVLTPPTDAGECWESRECLAAVVFRIIENIVPVFFSSEKNEAGNFPLFPLFPRT
jgi:hypothetical protein